MRKEKAAPGEYYHIYNRGVLKQDIFLKSGDWVRFLILLFYCQFDQSIPNIHRQANFFVQHRVLNKEVVNKEKSDRLVGLTVFCLMPNHFHLLVQEKEEGGIAKYMQRVQNAYTKYFNTKYEKSGHLFQGPYKIVHVGDNRQLLHLSAYIHRNPRELKGWKNKEETYPWSSFQDYTKTNRWGDFLEKGIIEEQFNTPKDYRKFLNDSPAKDLDFGS